MNVRNGEGDTAVHFAMKTNDLEIIMLMLEGKCDLNVMNKRQCTPLAFAKVEVLRRLDLEKGVSHVSEGMTVNNNALL